ncbi:hypothetical protein, partial [Thalassospira sp.]|uniref:hypothetical protein n=1 Tax=Thalassospira sp. TaxID=1912094 RepID=UPI00257C00EF
AVNVAAHAADQTPYGCPSKPEYPVKSKICVFANIIGDLANGIPIARTIAIIIFKIIRIWQFI